jgi:hypothetical protein
MPKDASFSEKKALKSLPTNCSLQIVGFLMTLKVLMS